MNAGSFIQYVEQLSKLYQLPYEELKSLSMEYPYFQNLHLLLALKSKLENHYDYPKNLARASTYSVDRAKLYRTLSQLESLVKTEHFLMHEDYLELEDVQSVAEKLKSLELLPQQPVQDVPIDLSPASNGLSASHNLPDEEIAPKQGLPASEENSSGISQEQLPELNQLVADNVAIAQCVHQWVRLQPLKRRGLLSPALDIEEKKKAFQNYLQGVNQKKPKPMPKQSFSTWIEQFQPAHLRPHLGDLMEAKQKEKNKNKPRVRQTPSKLVGDNLHLFAAKSIQENPNTASETLAEILVAQMQYGEAIKVYERLSLIFPEKSSFFAKKIENLKKLIS